MYRNLKAEMARNGWSIADLANQVDMKPRTLRAKLGDKTDFTLPEAIKIAEIFKVSDLQKLFEKSEVNKK